MFERLSALLYNGLNIYRLNKSFLQFSKGHLFFVVAINIQSVFVNILLIRQAGDPATTIYYNMICYSMSAIGMFLGGILAKRIDLRKIGSIGIVSQLCAYLLFLIFMEDVVSFMIPIAMLIGFGGGFFWFVYLNALSNYAHDDNRDVSIAFIGIFASGIALLVPTIAGVVIGMFVDLTGYTIMFACAFVFGGISLYLFSHLPDSTISTEKTAYLSCLKQYFTHPSFRYITVCLFTRSVRDGIFNFFLNVLLYQYVTNEALIGFNAFWVGFIGLFAQYVAGKFLRPNNRIKIMLIASIVLVGAALVLYLNLSAWTILFLCTINAFFVILLINPGTSVDFAVMQQLPDFYSHREEYLGLGELFRAIGRVSGLTLLLLLPETDFGYVTTLVVITLIQFVNVWGAKKALQASANMEETA